MPNIIKARNDLIDAFDADLDKLTSANQALITAAISNASPVDQICFAFRALANENDLAAEWRDVAIEIATVIVSCGFHGLGAQAADKIVEWSA